VNTIYGDVTDPETKLSIGDRLRAREIVGASGAARKKLLTGDLPIEALGSGSDFSPWLQHAGVASLNIGFGGEGEGTEYHSTYDTYQWQERFGDPGYVYGGVMAKTAGRMVIRLADADVLPFEFTHLATTLETYVKELTDLVEKERIEATELNDVLANGMFRASQDPSLHQNPPKSLSPVPAKVNLSPLQEAVARLKTAAEAFAKNPPSDPTVNARLLATERALLGPGLPKRPWYRHTVYAPGLYTGYGVKTLPGVREAIEQRDWTEAEAQAVIAAAAIDRVTALLNGK
jgi:N-acetylated-alpha-linked acidic dipeptidase